MAIESISEVFCWSKMGSEAGEGLEQIIRRKEIERKANNGEFVWGVGSSLGDSVEMLKQKTKTPSVVFTVMRSKPKKIDESPRKLLLWLGGKTRSGVRVELPRYSLLTSRGHTKVSDSKKKHYALLCCSSDAISLRNDYHFDGSSVVNLKTGNPVGSSQVTAIVKKAGQQTGNPRIYDVGFAAALSEHVQIILDRFVVISANDIQGAIEAAEAGDVTGWRSEILALKERKDMSAIVKQSDCHPQISMFAI